MMKMESFGQHKIPCCFMTYSVQNWNWLKLQEEQKHETTDLFSIALGGDLALGGLLCCPTTAPFPTPSWLACHGKDSVT